jgi:hypothetical protein
MASNRPSSHAQRAEGAKRESRYIDFKSSFDPSDKGEWVELIKDFAAMANSGGGAVVIGVSNKGQKSDADLRPVRELDPATITDKLVRYTGQNFSDFEVKEIKRGQAKAVVIEIGAASNLLVFSKPGTYSDPDKPGKQITAFGRGTIYFRHGAKSEPATAADVAAFVEAKVDKIREKWLGDIRRLTTAPPGTDFALIEQTASGAGGEPTQIRLTGDPSAPAFGKLDPDRTHPHLTKGMVQAVQDRLPDGRVFNTYDATCVRKTHNIEPDTKPEFIHVPKFGAQQYSDAYVEWLAAKPQGFFDDARTHYYEETHG